MDTYLQDLRTRSSFSCPYCRRTVLPFDFEVHIRDHHGFDTVGTCIWCLGVERRPSDYHLSQCSKKFFKELARTVVRLDPTKLCRPTRRREPPPPAGRDVREDASSSSSSSLPPLQHEGLETAVRELERFLKHRDYEEYFHVVFEKEVRPDVPALPFSRRCGGRRHFVCRVPKSSGSSPRRHLRDAACKRRLKTPAQFVDALRQLGREDVPCEFCCPGTAEDAVVSDLLLPPGFEAICALRWEDGVSELIQRWYENADPRLLVPVARSRGGLWGVRVGDLPGMPREFPIPVDRRLEPTRTKGGGGGGGGGGGDFEVELARDRKLYFSWKEKKTTDGVKEEEEEEEEDAKEWIERQTKMGNFVFAGVWDKIWFPTPHQQECISMFKEALESRDGKRNDELTRTKKRLKETELELDDLKRKYVDCLEKHNELYCKKIKKEKEGNEV